MKQEELASYKKNLGRKHEFFKMSKGRIYEFLEQCDNSIEAEEYLKLELREGIRAKLQFEKEVDQSPDFQERTENDINVGEEAIKEFIVFVQDKLKGYVELANFEREELKMGTEVEKIKWNGSPSAFAHLFLELANNGFVDLPLHSGEVNYSAYGRKLSDFFEVKSTPNNLKKEFNPNTNSLSNTKKAKFSLPKIEDIA